MIKERNKEKERRTNDNEQRKKTNTERKRTAIDQISELKRYFFSEKRLTILKQALSQSNDRFWL